MPERTEYAPGTPNWVDVSADDMDAAKVFYGGLFGWEAEAATEDPAESGNYHMFTMRGRPVAGLGPHQEGGPPPAWSTYIASDDVDKTLARATEAGGQVVVPAMDVMEAGRMAFVADGEGAVFGLWQAGDHIGAGIVNESGAFSWNELGTRDQAKAKDFYTQVFGWEPVEHDMGPMGTYVEFHLDGASIAGCMAMAPEVPAEVPPHWLTYFVVDDADAALQQVTELGGQVLNPAMDIPQGRFGIAADPNGAAFGVMKMSEE